MLQGTLASFERSVDVTTAIGEVQRVLRASGTLHLQCPSRRFPRQASASLVATQGVTVRSRGKGVGAQSQASALFELYEHAVSMGVVNRDDSNVEVPTSELYGATTIRPDALGRWIVNAGSETTLATPFFRVIGTGAVVWLPAAMYDELPVGEDEPHLDLAARYWSSNGYAAGMTIADATLHALNEVIERDAFSGFLVAVCRGRRTGTNIHLGGHALEDLRRDVEHATESTVHVRVLPSLTATVCLAIGSRHDYRGRRLVGLGCSAMPAYAVERSLLEYEQECAVEDEFAQGLLDVEDDDLDPDDSTVLEHEFFRRGYLLHDIPPAQQSRHVRELRPSPHQIVDIAALLSRAGYPVLRRTLHRQPRSVGSEVGPAVVQVVVVGAEKFHLVRLGLPVEPIGRFREPDVIAACRAGSGSLPLHYRNQRRNHEIHT